MRPRPHFPYGKALPAMERNILKYRAFEMVRYLFYSEELRRKIINTIKSFDGLMSRLRDRDSERTLVRVTDQTRKPFNAALKAMIEDGIISKDEEREIVKLTDYRNYIAHEVHMLVRDLSRENIAVDEWRLNEYLNNEAQESKQKIRKKPGYQYDALKRIIYWSAEISKRISKRYVSVLNFNRIYFDCAEKTYQNEMNRLAARVDRQLEAYGKRRNGLIARIKSVIQSMPEGLSYFSAWDKYEGGRLTPRGIELCYRYFELGSSAEMVAHLMQMRMPSARRRFLAWKQAGPDRKRVEIDPVPWEKPKAATG